MYPGGYQHDENIYLYFFSYLIGRRFDRVLGKLGRHLQQYGRPTQFSGFMDGWDDGAIGAKQLPNQ